MSNKKRKHMLFDDYLTKQLQDPELALNYLNEALADDDARVFLLALKDVLKARGDNISALSQQTNLNRQNLYRMLSEKGNPQWGGINSLFDALGLQVQLSFKDPNKSIKK